MVGECEGGVAFLVKLLVGDRYMERCVGGNKLVPVVPAVLVLS